MCSRGVFSCLRVGCTKGCRATSKKPCWYRSRSWAGRSRREASLTAEDRGSSAGVERGEAHQARVGTACPTPPRPSPSAVALPESLSVTPRYMSLFLSSLLSSKRTSRQLAVFQLIQRHWQLVNLESQFSQSYTEKPISTPQKNKKK